MVNHKKTESELLEEANRQAEAALRQMPEPAEVYASSETEQEVPGEPIEDDRERLTRLEQMLQELMARLPRVPLVVPATTEDLPQVRKQWTPAEMEELLTITIFPESDPNQNRPVDLCHNGTKYTIPRGVPTRVPRKVVLILEQAVIDSWEYPIENGRYLAVKTDLDTLTTSQPVHRRIPRFNFAYS